MNISTVLTIVIPPILTFVLGLLIARAKNSIIKLSKKIQIQAVANSYEDDFWGNIKVLHNEEVIDHLHLIQIEIINNTRKDVGDFVLRLASGDSNRIISSYGINNDTRVLLEETQDFVDQKEVKNWKYLNESREYDVPVLNRGTHLTISLLVDSKNEMVDDDEITVAIEKQGTRLVPYRTISSDLLGTWSFIIGALITVIAGLITYKFYPNSFTPIMVVTIVGALNLFLGVLTFYSVVGWRHANDD